MNSRHSPLGAVAWLLTLQFFLAEYVVEQQWSLPYDRNTYYISDLGALGCFTSADGRAVCSPWHALMNTSFVLQGVLIVTGAVLLRRSWPGRFGQVGTALFVVAGLGVGLVGLFPEDTVHSVHYAGAALNFAGGNAALVLVAIATRGNRAFRGPGLWSGLLGWLGLVGLALLVAGADLGLGIGGLERVIAYPIPLALPVLGLTVMLRHRRSGVRPG